MASAGEPSTPILEEAYAAADRAQVRLAPDVVRYLLNKYPPRDHVAPLRAEDEARMRQNAAQLILEAAALSGGEPGSQLELASVKSAVATLCERYPDFWPFCPP
jgi:hypothetical protein